MAYRGGDAGKHSLGFCLGIVAEGKSVLPLNSDWFRSYTIHHTELRRLIDIYRTVDGKLHALLVSAPDSIVGNRSVLDG